MAHQAGASDPKSYALLLERVGVETRDAGYASHWLSEAANVWSTTLGDAHRAARVLMQAIDRDPTQRVASDRLAQLYREKADYKALVALLERRAKALGSIAPQSPEIRAELAEMHEELGRLWNDNLQQPKKAQENLRRAIELGDPVRQIGILRDEAAGTVRARDLASATLALARAAGARPARRRAPAGVRGASSSSASRPASPCPARSVPWAPVSSPGSPRCTTASTVSRIRPAPSTSSPGHDRARAALRVLRARARRGRTTSASATSPTSRPTRAAPWQARPDGFSPRATRRPARRRTRSRSSSRCAPWAIPRRPRSSVTSTPRSGERCRARLRSRTTVPARRCGRRGPASARRSETALDAAQAFATAGKRPDAYKKYREVLAADPIHPEALSWVQDYLRTKRDYAPLRDVLLAAVRAPGESVEARRDRLREVAGLCESNLRDIDGAIAAWKQLLAIDRVDETARQSLTRLARTHPAMGRPREPLRAGGERRDRSREEARAPEEARRAARGQAQGRGRRGRGLGAHRERDAGGRAVDLDGVQDVHESGGARPRGAGHRVERAQRHGCCGARARSSRASASSTKSWTIRRGPATPTPTRPEKARTAASCGRPRSVASSPQSGGIARGRRRCSARSSSPIRRARRGTSRAAPTTSARGGDEAGALVNLVQAAELEPDERGVRAAARRTDTRRRFAGTTWSRSS